MKHNFVSYLDLMCCGYGGALLMFLIVASAQSHREESSPMLVMRAKGMSPDAKPLQSIELGIQYRRRGEVSWTRANASITHESICGAAGEAWFFNSRPAGGNGSEAVFICNRPRAGQWEVRAYSVLTAAEESLGDTATTPSPPLNVQVEVLGAERYTFKNSLMERSAQFTEPVPFEISGPAP